MKTTPAVVGIDHVQLAMPPGGEDGARAFYAGILGLAEVPKPPLLATRGGCWFQSGPVKLHLGVEPAFHPATKAHVALQVAGLAELVARCRQGGYRVVEESQGHARAQVHDPFGNRLELLEHDR